MLNPIDLFAQIGFVVESSPSRTSRRSISKSPQHKKNCEENPFEIVQKSLRQEKQKKPAYVTSLEIQLTQDENYILQIKSYDDPFQIANNFCRMHDLNLLAVEVVEKKIIEAKRRQEMRLKFLQQSQQLNSIFEHDPELPNIKSSNPKQLIPNNNCNQHFIKQNPIVKKKPDHSRSITPSKLKRQISANKTDKTPKNELKQSQNNKKKLNNKESQAILSRACQSLYERGLKKNKDLQEKRKKRQQQLQKKQTQQLTLKPKLNEVSEKIIEFRKQTGTIPPRNTNKFKQQEMTQNLYKELKQCTFTPEINPISKMIVHNRDTYLNENDHFNYFFNSQESNLSRDISQAKKKPLAQIHSNLLFNNRKSKQYLIQQKQIEDRELFKPKLNQRSIEQVKESFFARLEKAIETKQKIKEGEYKNDQFTFQPQVGRSPFYQALRGQNSRSDKENIPVWQQLYRQSQIRAKQRQKLQENKSRNQLTNSTSEQDFESVNHNQSKNSLNITHVKASTNLHYENLIQKRISTVFQLLDSDQDGIISPNRIGIENLSKNTLIFLKPVFEQMDEFNAELSFSDFRKAVINLLNDSDTYKKGLFLSDNKRIKNQFTFTPTINQKSKELAQGRNMSQIHVGLYQQGIKNLKRKEMLIQRQKAKKEEMQLQECSFKPCLHLGRKDYVPSILDRKLSDIQFSVNQSSNSRLMESAESKQKYPENESY